MWFDKLLKEDKKVLMNAFNEDGFKVNQTKNSLVAEKSGQTIILTNLEEAKVKFDIKKWLSRNNLLCTHIGGLDYITLNTFLHEEKSFQESSIDCLKRLARKLNWGVLYSGEKEIDRELSPLLGDVVSFVEIETDSAEIYSVISFNLNGYEKLYIVNNRFRQVYKLIQSIKIGEEFQELAPKAFLALQNISSY